MREFALRRTMVAIAALSLAATACGGGAEEPAAAPAPAPAPAPEAEETGPIEVDEFVVGIAQDIAVLDARLPGNPAAGFSAIRHITEPLVFFNATGEFVPVLAESWEKVEPLRWRFTLRQGVTFHDGTPFDADAVVASIADAVNPDFTVWFRYATGSVLETAEKVDDYTVDIITKIDTNQLPNVLTLVDMVSPNHNGPEQNESPVGTGPFTFGEFVPKSNLTLNRNDDYWGEKPAMKSVTFRIIPEDSTRLQALLTGEVQVINRLSPEMIGQIDGDAAAQVVSSATTRHIMVALRHDQPVTGDVRIRQAMNYAVDKQLIADTILTGIASPAGTMLAETLPGSVDLGPYPYDPARAEALLAEAGYAGEPITIAVGAGRYPNDEQVGQAVLAQLEAVGFNIDYQAVDFATMTAEVNLRKESSYDGWLQGWGATLLDSVGMLNAFYGGESASLPLFYENAEYTEVITAALATQDAAEFDRLIEEAQRIVWEDAGGLFLYFPVENLGVAGNVQGMQARFDEFFFVFPGVTVTE